MSNVLEYRIGGKTVADVVLQPIEQKGISLNVVDVGARSGLFFLPPSYAK